MTRNHRNVTKPEIKALLSADEDLLKGLVQIVLQQVLEAEMEDALGAGKSERTEGRLGYRSGHLHAPADHARGHAGAAGAAGPAGPL